jgi:hypothetical protein
MAIVHHDGPCGDSFESAVHFKEHVANVTPIEIRLS